MPQDNYATISNTALSSDALWEKIAGDFQFAVDNLPVKQAEVGRPSQAAAYGFLAKTRLFQAYTQDDKYNVTGIDKGKMQAALDAADKALNSSFHLEQDFANNFCRAISRTDLKRCSPFSFHTTMVLYMDA